ncbi:MAG: NAD(P)H-dependent oxidoreductase subunit E [Candidatus Goldiibacteriota bacterium]
MGNTVHEVIKKYNGDETRLMDILIDTQSAFGYLSDWTIEQISNSLDVPRVDIEQTVSFYHFFTKEPRGKYTVYLNNSVVSVFNGYEKIKETFEKELGIKMGEVTEDGLVGLFPTPCIGMSDQEPAAIINEEVFTSLTEKKVKDITAGMKAGKTVKEIKGAEYGDGNNEKMRAMVKNNIIKRGEVILNEYVPGSTLEKISKMSSDEVIRIIKESAIKGRGGAGFPTGMKWEFAKKAKSDIKYIFCNADEGEPGTFKDRVILTEKPYLVFAGMIIAGYAVGAKQGILYLRNEYRYMREFLESVLDDMRKKGHLGNFISGIKGFDFDIRIQFGAGAYVCGEESALIESAEGKRGEPRDRPPFPVEKGYLQKPTVVNNVETLCAIVKILLNGPEWYNGMGTSDSKGTKVLSISGDCEKPGIYEIEWGFTVNDILKMAGAKDVQAVQVGGPSGSCIAENEFNRVLCYSDLATGGSMIIIGKNRDLLKDVVLNFTEFFIEESCGSCVPCRALTPIYREVLKKVIDGKGTKKDLMNLIEWKDIMKKNRCGLGQTAMNPIVTSLKNFRSLYEEKVKGNDDEFLSGFDEKAAVSEYDAAVK